MEILLFGLLSNERGSAGKLYDLKLSSHLAAFQYQKVAFYCWRYRHHFCGDDFDGSDSLLNSIVCLKTNNKDK